MIDRTLLLELARTHATCSTGATHEFLHDGLMRFAEAIAELERQRCAELCKQADRYRGGYFAELVMRND